MCSDPREQLFTLVNFELNFHIQRQSRELRKLCNCYKAGAVAYCKQILSIIFNRSWLNTESQECQEMTRCMTAWPSESANSLPQDFPNLMLGPASTLTTFQRELLLLGGFLL